MSEYSKLFARKISAEEQAERGAQKALVQRESDMKSPATGFGISISEAALRLGLSVEQVNQMIEQGQFKTARADVDRTGENEQTWVSGVEVFEMSGSVVRYKDSDLH